MARFDRKSAVVIGAGSIGGASARMLAEGGASVTIADVNLDYAQAAADAVRGVGGRAEAVTCDMSDAASVAAVFSTAMSAYGGVDLLHVNAADTEAVFKDSDAVATPDEVIDRSIAVNLKGPLHCVRQAIPAMLERGGGSIVFTTAEAAYIFMEHSPLYAMTKAALQPLARHIAAKWGKQGIRANCVAPGLIMSDRAKMNITEEFKSATLADLRVPRLGEPDDVAAATAFLLSAEAGYINGQVLSLSGGQYHH